MNGVQGVVATRVVYGYSYYSSEKKNYLGYMVYGSSYLGYMQGTWCTVVAT